MTENTKIEWADHTFNPWMGCTKVSAACDHCYAEGLTARFKQWGEWAPQDFDDMRRIGKTKAGRKLDGVTHDGFPHADSGGI